MIGWSYQQQPSWSVSRSISKRILWVRPWRLLINLRVYFSWKFFRPDFYQYHPKKSLIDHNRLIWLCVILNSLGLSPIWRFGFLVSSVLRRQVRQRQIGTAAPHRKMEFWCCRWANRLRRGSPAMIFRPEAVCHILILKENIVPARSFLATYRVHF